MQIVPPREIFAVPPQSPSTRLADGGYEIDSFREATRSPDGEMLSIFGGFPVPRKGMVYLEAVSANNEVKRLALSMLSSFASKGMILPAIGFLFTPFKWKIDFLNHYLLSFVRLADSVYAKCERIPNSIKYEYYANAGKSVWDMTKVFLTELGISSDVADRLGHILATLLEFDDFYRLLIIDPMTDFTQEEILKNPNRFPDKFIKLIRERVLNVDSSVGSQTKIHKLVTLLKYALYIPKVRNAFKKAVGSIEFRKIQLDKYEIFWNLPRTDYSLQGRPFQERFLEHLQAVREHLKKINNCDELEEKINPDGSVSLTPIFYEHEPGRVDSTA